MSNDKLVEARTRIKDWIGCVAADGSISGAACMSIDEIFNDLQARAAEAAQAQDGEWVMVPREPTQAMLDANGSCEGFPEGKAWLEEDARVTWANMLAAAPQPQAAEPVAWMVGNDDKGTPAFVTTEPSIPWNYQVPLYTHPQPAQDAKDAARLDWFDSRAFTAYKTRDPESGVLFTHATVVDEDRSPRMGQVRETIREAIDAAMVKESGR